jgi:hypothetical protein
MVLLFALLPKFPESHLAFNTREGLFKAFTSMFNTIKDMYALEIYANCVDKYMRHCCPQLPAWIGDTLEHSLLRSIISRFCSVCKILKNCMEKQSSEWEHKIVINLRKQLLTNDKARPRNIFSIDDFIQQHSEVPLIKRFLLRFYQYWIVAPGLLYQLHLYLFKYYLIS